MIRDQRGAAQALLGLLVMSMLRLAMADTIAIPAREPSDRSKNVVPIDEQWNGLVVCHGGDGMKQRTVKIEKPGPHYLHFR